MESLEITDARTATICNLAQSYGYRAMIAGEHVIIFLHKTKMFAYCGKNNSLFTYKSKYSKQLDDRFAHYIRACLKNNLPEELKNQYPKMRYVVVLRGSSYAVYDDYTGSKMDSYVVRCKAEAAASQLNAQWLTAVNNKGL